VVRAPGGALVHRERTSATPALARGRRALHGSLLISSCIAASGTRRRVVEAVDGRHVRQSTA
jgi:hypothetical protein